MKTFLKYAAFIMMGLAGLALLMIFITQLKSGARDWSGLDIVFGCTATIYGETASVFEFSFMNLLTYALVIACGVLDFLYYKKENRKLLLIAIICAFVAALFFFLAKEFTVASSLVEESFAADGESFKDYTELAAGAIFGGLFSIAAGVVGLIKFNEKQPQSTPEQQESQA